MTSPPVRLQMIGGGRMGQALLAGLIAAEWALPESLAVVEVSETQRESLSAAFPKVQVLAQPLAGVDAVVAVKPYLAVEVCEGLAEPQRVMSIAAGITVAALEAALASSAIVIRVMPNTPSLLGAGAAGVAGGSRATAADVQWAIEVLQAVGVAVEVEEPLIDSVTGLSGSGPAYVFQFAHSLAEAGQRVGLSAEVARQLANQTILGAARLLTETDQTAIELRDMVATPGGTTEAGLNHLADAGFEEVIAGAVAAATTRSKELGA